MNKRTYIAGGMGLAMILAVSLTGCTRDIDSEILADFPNISNVFIDGFASDMDFQAWGKSTNFSIDNDTKYEGTASIKIEVPGPDDPLGSWAGGNLFSKVGRNLTGYDALTFYAKASVPATLQAGFGNYGDNSDYQVSVNNLKLNTNWQQYIIPIPNAAKLVSEKGLFYYSAGQVDGNGYSIWIDDVKFVRYGGLLAHPTIKSIERAGFPGNVAIGNLTETVNLPNGINQTMTVSSKYFTFESSNTDIASIEDGSITVHKAGDVVLTAKEAEGQIKLNCLDFAPTPTKDAADVISLFSDTYQNTISANWNPHWEYSTAEYEDIDTGKGHVAQYNALNFVGIVFNTSADCSAMTHLHLDVLSLDEVSAGSHFKIEVHNGTTNTANTFTPMDTPDFKKGKWVSLDIPLNGLGNNKNINQLVLECGGIQNILLDNIYFYK